MVKLDVNNVELIALTARLEALSKSAFPSAVRNTLNRAAFETKNQVPKSAEKLFITRQKSFFKTFTTVEKADGFDVRKMKSIVGIDATKNKEVAENLESQEFGGMVNAKKLIPHDDSRVSRAQNKRVSSQNRLNNIKAYDGTKAFRANKGSRGSKFVAAVMGAAKSGKSHMILKSGGKGMVYEVTGVSQNKKTKKISFKTKKLYSVRSGKTHKVQSRGFMSNSVSLVSKNIHSYFIENAEYQFKKSLKK